jgi:hypothetical protein
MRAAAPRCAWRAAASPATSTSTSAPRAAALPQRSSRRAPAACRGLLVVAAAAADGAGAPAAEIRDALRATSGVISDASVPEAHRGLHATLYGDGGAEAHDAGAAYRARAVRAAECGGACAWRGSACARRRVSTLSAAKPSAADARECACAACSPARPPTAHSSSHTHVPPPPRAAAAGARAQGEDDGSAVLPLTAWLAEREGATPTGVYAVYDASKALYLVSYSRNVVLAVRGHLVRARRGARRALHAGGTAAKSARCAP